MTDSVRTVERCMRIARAPRRCLPRPPRSRSALPLDVCDGAWRPRRGRATGSSGPTRAVPAVTQGEILEIEEDKQARSLVVHGERRLRDGRKLRTRRRGSGRHLRQVPPHGIPGRPDLAGPLRPDRPRVGQGPRESPLPRGRAREGVQPLYLRLQAKLPASRERAHLYWVGPAAIRTWLAERAFVDPAVGGEIDLTCARGGACGAPPDRLRSGSTCGCCGMRGEEEPDRHLHLAGRERIGPHDHAALLRDRRGGPGSSARDVGEPVHASSRVLQRAPESRAPAAGRAITLERVVTRQRDRRWKAWMRSRRGWHSGSATARSSTRAPAAPAHSSGRATARTRGQVREIEDDGSRLSWDVPGRGGTTEVDVRLPADTDPAKTRLALTHAGWREGPAWNAEFHAAWAGWRTALAMLEFALRDGGKGPRRGFLLRRRTPASPSDLWRRFSTPDGLASWIGGESSIDPREDGRLQVRLKDGIRHRRTRDDRAIRNGASRSSSMRRSASALAFGWSTVSGETRLFARGFTFGSLESWPLRRGSSGASGSRGSGAART